MAGRTFSESTMELFLEFRSKVTDQTGQAKDAREFDPAAIIGIFNFIGGLIQQLAAFCNKTPPEPPPVPAELAAEGVSKTAWKMAYQTKWGAEQAWLPAKNKYHTAATNHAAKELAKQNKTKKKLEKPATIAAFDTARDPKNTVEVLARAARDSGH